MDDFIAIKHINCEFKFSWNQCWLQYFVDRMLVDVVYF